MATPVEYTQQYIPTSADLSFMQGQLGELQADYDAGYAAPLMFEQEFSQLPVTGDNMAGKQAVLNNFQDKIKSVADKYGGDYGAASKDIVREITKERQKPFYQLAPQHAKAAEEARKYKLSLGANALVKKDVPSTFVDDKGNITTTDFSYDISDVRDFEKPLAQMFKEHATGLRRVIDYDAGDGYRRKGEQFGARDANEAAMMLQGEEGQQMMQKAYGMYGMKPGENSTLDAFIYNTAVGNLVGTRQTQLVQDLDMAAARKAAAKANTPSYGPGIEFSELGKGGINVVSTTRGRDKKNVTNLLTTASSTLNPDLSQAVKNEVLTGDVYVYGTSPDRDIEGKIKKGGQPITDKSIAIEEGTLQGYNKFLKVSDLEGVGPKAQKKINAAKENGDLESLGVGTLFSTGADGEGRSPLEIAGDDANISYDYIDQGIIVINQGTDEQINVSVSPFNGKVYTDNKGRTIVQGVGRSEAMRAFGMGHGDDLINNGEFLKTDEPLIQAHLDERYNQLVATDPQKAKAMIMAAEYLKAKQPVENVPDLLQQDYLELIQAINQREFQSHRPIITSKTIDPGGF